VGEAAEQGGDEEGLSPRARRLFAARGWIALALGLSFAAALVAATGLGLDFTPQRIFESGDEEFAYLVHIQEVFGRDDNAIVVHLDAPGGLFRPERLAFLRDLHDALTQVEGVAEVDDLTTAVVLRRGMPLPTPLLPPGAELSTLDLEQARELALGSPLLVGRLVSKQADAAVLLVQIDPVRSTYDELSPVVHDVLDVLEALRRPDGLETLATGIPTVRVLIVERLIEDQLTYFPVCTLLFFFALWALFRDLRAVVVPLLAVFLSLVYTVGLLGITGENIDIINNVLPVLIFVIGISDAIHLIARYRRELSAGRPQRVALWAAVRHLAVACFLTSVTTAAGFASLGVAEISILVRFGLYAGCGVLIAYAVTIVFLPLAYSWLGPLVSEAGRRADRLSDTAAHVIGDFGLRHRKVILVTGGLLMLTAVGFASQVREQNNLYEAFPSDDPLVEANRRLEAGFSGVIPISIVVTADEGIEPLQPEILAYVSELEQRVVAHPDFSNALSLADLLAEWNAARHLGDPEWRRLPDTLVDVRMGMLQLSSALAARGQTERLRRLFAPDLRMLRLAAFCADGGANELHEAVRELQRGLDADVERQRELGITCRISGDGPVASAGVNRLISDLLTSLLLAFVIIFATMWLLLGSLRAAMVSMIPNLFPLVLTLGCMGALGIDLRVTTVIVFSVSLGLAVDDTIHFMARFREEWKRVIAEGSQASDPYELAIRRTFVGTGSAIVATSALLAAGFAVLLFSRFPVTATFAFCLEVTVLAAVIGDLLLLPACLVLLRPFRS
jgi:predicted RND superfamily exporter protein